MAAGGIGDTWSKRHVRARLVVMDTPFSEQQTQMGFRDRDQPVQALTPDRADEAFADRIGHRAAYRGLHDL
jgi:hypothetical protein